MDPHGFQVADFEPFDYNISWLDKLTFITLLNTITEYFENKELKFILYITNFYFMTFL